MEIFYTVLAYKQYMKIMLLIGMQDGREVVDWSSNVPDFVSIHLQLLSWSQSLGIPREIKNIISFQGPFGVIWCTFPKITFNLKMAACKSKIDCKMGLGVTGYSTTCMRCLWPFHAF